MMDLDRLVVIYDIKDQPELCLILLYCYWLYIYYIYVILYCVGTDILIFLLSLFLVDPCLSCPGAPDFYMSWLVPVSVSTPSIV